MAAGLLDSNHKIESEEGAVFFPLCHELEPSKIRDIIGGTAFRTGARRFNPVVRGPRTLRDAMIGRLTPEELNLLPRAYDLVGDIAVLEIPDELMRYGREIGAAFLAIHKGFSTVLAKRGAVSGTTRTRGYDLLAGDDRTRTVHTEYDCRISVDLAAAYFSPRLLEEHQRVARQVRDDEFVVDMFTGVGCFALHIAKLSRSRVVAIDINPEAIQLLQESMKMNRLKGVIVPVVADSRQYVKDNFNRIADHVIMNHPSSASEFVPQACQAVRDRGMIHYYEFVGAENPEEQLIERVTQLIGNSGREVLDITQVKRIRESAPHEYQIVTDVVIR